jgi:acyl carrier protein
MADIIPGRMTADVDGGSRGDVAIWHESFQVRGGLIGVHAERRTRVIATIVSSRADAILTRQPSSLFMPSPASVPIAEGVIDVLKNVSRRPIDPVLTSDLVADLGFDSLQVLEVIAELEDRFDISIPLNDVPSTRTVAQVVDQVARLVEERSNS